MQKKILLIDDSSTQLEMLKMKLEHSGFVVDTANDGYHGYKSVFTSTPDIILSDIVMPDLNGFQLCKLLKNSDETKKIPIMLLTVLDKKVDKFWANKSGADIFISKNSEYQDIEKLINELIEKNPISNEYKNYLKAHEKTLEEIRYEISEIFDALLMNATFLREFRELNKYLQNEKILISETFKLLNSFVDYDIAGLFLSNLDKNEKNILQLDTSKVPVSKFVTEKLKRDFFEKMKEYTDFETNDFAFSIVNEYDLNNGNMDAVLNIDKFQTKFIYPFYADDKLYGGFCLYKLDEKDYTKCKFYDTMLDELLILMKMKYIYSETEHSSVTDGLTGLYNRRLFNTNIEREFLRVKRYHTELSIAMIDIDFFKKVNDTYGHQFGDYVLKEISKILQNSLRKTDMIYRYGGEELIIILPETSFENAFIPLEGIREKIETHDFSYNGESIKVTISVGVGCYNETVKSAQMLIESTDEALYKAKQTGRNKVVMAEYEQYNNITK